MSVTLLIAVVVATGVAVVLVSLWAAARRGSGGSGGEFLCDRCKYNDPRYCSQAERPNARSCPDFKGR